MTERAITKLSKWPFILGDVFFLGVAIWIVFQSPAPITLWPAIICLAAVALGAWLCVLPFLREHAAALKLAEADTLADTVAQMQNLEAIRTQITDATGRWRDVQNQSEKTVHAAREISDRMTAQMQEFNAFFKKASDQEKHTLQLEVEKLKRTEADWLQVLVRILDNVHALQQAGVRTQQPELIRELTQFQSACRETARRVGLVQFVPAVNDPFDTRLHQTPDPRSIPAPNALIAESIAPGITFQAQLVRRALVRVTPAAPSTADKPGLDDTEGQNVLNLDRVPSLKETSETSSDH